MKYIKFFEAFENKILGNILSFLKNKNLGNKEKFIKQFKSITSHFNIPISKISDSDVEYLNTSKAIKVKNKNIKGSSIKTINFNDGTVVYNARMYCIKFWFSLDNGYLGYTGVGYNYLSNGLNTIYNDDEIYYIKEDLNIKTGTLSDVNYEDLKTGDKVIGYLGNNSTKRNLLLSTIYNDGINIYAIQNYKDGARSSNNDWMRYGTYSFKLYLIRDKIILEDHIGLYKYTENEFTLSYSNIKEYYLFNLPVDKNFKLQVWNKNNLNYMDMIKNSEYCIILYLNNKYSLEEIRNKRIEAKSDALKLINDDLIKKQNIKRYFDKILFNMGFHVDTKGLRNLQKIQNMCLCDEYSIIASYKQLPSIHNIHNLTFNLYNMLKYNNKKYLSVLIDEYEYVLNAGKNCKKRYEEAYSIIMKSNNKELIEIFSFIIEIGTKIKNYISSQDIQTIEDMEILTFKIKSIRDLLYSNYIGLNGPIENKTLSIINTFDDIENLRLKMDVKIENVDDQIKRLKHIDKYITSILK